MYKNFYNYIIKNTCTKFLHFFVKVLFVGRKYFFYLGLVIGSLQINWKETD